MGRKVHPVGFRIGIIRDWQGKWYSDKNYLVFLHEDFKLRNAVITKYPEAAIAKVDIDRQANEIAVTIHTARPGIVIGRGGQRVEEMRKSLEKLPNWMPYWYRALLLNSLNGVLLTAGR